MKLLIKKILPLALFLTISSCKDYPKDPNDTLKKIQDNKMLVGYSENIPWTKEKEAPLEPEGLEVTIIKKFAKELNAKIIWVNDTEQELFQKLENRNIHLVIAGITKDNPWKKKVAFTRPYIQKGNEQHVMATQQGENAFLIKLEKFLHKNQEPIKVLLANEEKALKH